MKTKIIKLILFSSCIIFAGRVNAQHVIIDYQAWDPSNPPCNLFAVAINVPANIVDALLLTFSAEDNSPPFIE